MRNAAERLGYSHRDIISGAGHDACWINRVAPTAMIMCPCVDGLSHNEAEEISKDWATAGADVLLHAVLDAAEIAGVKCQRLLPLLQDARGLLESGVSVSHLEHVHRHVAHCAHAAF